MSEQAALFPPDSFLLDATHPLIELDPASITLEPVEQRLIVTWQARASRAIWRPAPGRKVGYAVRHDRRTIGLMFLASPVINLGVRDQYLNLPRIGKGTALRKVTDMSVCVGIQPLAWHWNLGKLVAMLAASNTVAEGHRDAYGDQLEWVTTTSLYGRGSQYNRIYKFLGYTKGYGHAHITEEEYQGMLSWMRANGVPVPSSSFGAGSNPRMRRIAAYQRATGQTVNLRHGDQRGVYITPANQGTVEEIVTRWHDRWGRPRYDRTKDQTPPYATGRSDEGQQTITRESP